MKNLSNPLRALLSKPHQEKDASRTKEPSKKRVSPHNGKKTKTLTDRGIEVDKFTQPSQAKRGAHASKASKSKAAAPVNEKSVKATPDTPMLRATKALAMGLLGDAQQAIAEELTFAQTMAKKSSDAPATVLQHCDACLNRFLPKLELDKLERMERSLHDFVTDDSNMAVISRMNFMVKAALLLRLTDALESKGIRFESGDESGLNHLPEAVLLKLKTLSYDLAFLVENGSQAERDELAGKNLPFEKLLFVHEQAFKASFRFEVAEKAAIKFVKAAPADLNNMPLTDLKQLKDAVDHLLVSKSRSVPKTSLPADSVLHALLKQIADTEETIAYQLIGPLSLFDASNLKDTQIERLHFDMGNLHYVPKALETHKKAIDTEFSLRRIDIKHAISRLEAVTPTVIAKASVSEIETLLSLLVLILSVPQTSSTQTALVATINSLMATASTHVGKAEAAALASAKVFSAAALAATAADTAAAAAKAKHDVAAKPTFVSKAKAKAAVKASEKAVVAKQAAAKAKATADANDASKAHAQKVEALAQGVLAQVSAKPAKAR